MEEKITQIQIGADVRDIGLGKVASEEVHKYVMGTTANANLGLGTDAYWRLYPLLGVGLRLSTDAKKCIRLDTAFTSVPSNLFTRAALVSDLNLGSGLMDNAGKIAVNLGSGLVFDVGKITPNIGTGLKYSGGGEITPNIGSGLKYSGGGEITPNLGSGLMDNAGKIAVNLGSGLVFDVGKITPNIGTGLKYSGGGEIIPHVNSASGIEINKDLGLTLDTETVGEMLTLEGDGTVISNGSGLCVNYGTGLTIQGDYLIPQVCRGLEIYNVAGESKIGIGVRLGTAMRHGGSPMAIGVDIDSLLTAIQSDERYINTLKAMLGLT